MSCSAIGFFERSDVSKATESEPRLKAFGCLKPSGFTSFAPSSRTRVFVGLPKSVTTSEASSKRPLQICAFRFLTSSRSSVTGEPDDAAGPFSSFCAAAESFGFSSATPPFASNGSSMRVKLSTFFSSKT